jgi:hypothetical protein
MNKNADFKSFRFPFLLVTLLFLNCTLMMAQTGVKGFMRSESGKPLTYATLYVHEKKTGTVTNEQGYFEFPLPSGTWHIDFQHLGYQTVSKTIVIGNGMQTHEISLKPQVVTLPIVTISASDEDPAYVIMRKAIASAMYYRLLIKSYESNIYIKGFGKVKVPGIVQKLAKSEGLDTAEYFLSETVCRLSYNYPNTYRQQVLSARSNDKDTARTPINSFINANIYEPKFGETVSPLSPSAFSFYRFKLENTFLDKNYEINKIKVIPRSRGANVFEGEIYIIDGLWAVYSFNLKTYIQGFEMVINEMFAPVEEKVWFPVNHRYDFDGSFFGVKFGYQYLASLSDYKVTLNDTIKIENMMLVDEKTQADYAKAVEEEKLLRMKGKSGDSIVLQKPAGPEKFTLSEFKKKMKEMEKESAKKKKEPEVISDYTIIIDTNARRIQPAFWDSIRPIALTEIEKKPSFSYKNDSIKAVRKSDTASKSQVLGKFFGGLFFGNKFKLTKNWWFNYPSPLVNANFNPVEGFNLSLPLTLSYENKGNNAFSIGGEMRYGFSSKVFYARSKLVWKFKREKAGNGKISISGGKFVNQVNPGEPIFSFINSLSTLFWVQNHMKLYEKTYGNVSFSTQIKGKYGLKAGIEFAGRKELFNTTNYTWVRRNGREYTPNAPVNMELKNTSFAGNQALLINLGFKYKPFLKYYKRNGKLIPEYNSFPVLGVEYTGAVKGIAGSDADWHRIEGSIHHLFSGVRGELEMKVSGGTTFHNGDLCFVDFKHFAGNRTIIQIPGPVDGYRLLEYYNYSTQDAYIGALTSLRMNRFLLSRMFWLNIAGVRESLSVNYLRTATSPNYLELGYGIENILKMIKIEGFVNFEDMKYREFGVRIGLSLGGAVRIEFEE